MLDCRSCEQDMNDFIDNSLIGNELWDFLNHVRNCPTCYEELETRYLLSEALTRLENGETIDLHKELEHKINYSRFTLRLHRHVDSIARSMEIIAGIIVAYSLMYQVLEWI